MANVELKSDADFVIAVIEHDISCLKHAAKCLFSDRDFALRAVRKDVRCLEHMDVHLRSDVNFMVPLLREHPGCRQFASAEVLAAARPTCCMPTCTPVGCFTIVGSLLGTAPRTRG